MEWILVAVGGAIGALLRYTVSVGMLAFGGQKIWATLFVNGLGCFIAGMLLTWVQSRTSSGLAPWVHPFLMIGILGAFTTFSAFSVETLALLQSNQLAKACLNIGLNLGVSLLAVGCGHFLIRS